MDVPRRRFGRLVVRKGSWRREILLDFLDRWLFPARSRAEAGAKTTPAPFLILAWPQQTGQAFISDRLRQLRSPLPGQVKGNLGLFRFSTKSEFPNLQHPESSLSSGVRNSILGIGKLGTDWNDAVLAYGLNSGNSRVPLVYSIRKKLIRYRFHSPKTLVRASSFGLTRTMLPGSKSGKSEVNPVGPVWQKIK